MGNIIILLAFLAEAAVGYYVVDRAVTFIAIHGRSKAIPTAHPESRVNVLKNSEIAYGVSHRLRSLPQIPVDVLKSILMLALASGISTLFDRWGFSEANIIMAYILGTVLISTITNHRAYGIVSSIVSVILFNYLFTEPRYTLFVYETGYQSTFLIMFTCAAIIGTLNQRLKVIANEKAEAELRIKSEQMRANLLRAISHDLRTPLTAISGHASNLLANENRFDAATRRVLYQDICDDSAYLIDLVENLLSVSRITDGKMHMQAETENLEDILDEAILHVNRKVDEHVLKLDMPDDMILVNVDSRLLMQVIINLVNNAIAYTPKHSVITIGARQAGKEAVITVADNGPGVSDDEKEKIFGLFYSGNNERGDGVRSTGIGLAVCRSIIQAHHGTIRVRDTSPKGTTFEIRLPIVEVQDYE